MDVIRHSRGNPKFANCRQGISLAHLVVATPDVLVDFDTSTSSVRHEYGEELIDYTDLFSLVLFIREILPIII